MTDFRYTENKQKCIDQIKIRIKSLEKGETIQVAELVFIALSFTFGRRLVTEIIGAYADLGTVRIGFKDGVAYSITKL